VKIPGIKKKSKNELEWLRVGIVLNWKSLVKEDWIELKLWTKTLIRWNKTVLQAVHQYAQKSCSPGQPEMIRWRRWRRLVASVSQLPLQLKFISCWQVVYC